MLIFIGLIVLVATPNRPPVLMIEEPENGLTPQAIKAFYQSLRILALNPKPEQRSQILISSHSPFVICEAWNGEDRDFIQQVKVTEGRTGIRKFSAVVNGLQSQSWKGRERKSNALESKECRGNNVRPSVVVLSAAALNEALYLTAIGFKFLAGGPGH